MPAMNNILSKWVPVSERSRSLAFVYSGMYLGSVTGLAFSPFLIHQFGWPSVFYSFGSLGTVWFAAWLSKVNFALCRLSLFFIWHVSCQLIGRCRDSKIIIPLLLQEAFWFLTSSII
jgi:MFS family permease